MLLKSLLKTLRKRLLNFNRIRRVVASSLNRIEEERQTRHRAILLCTGYTLRKKDKSMNLDPHQTSATVTDDGVIVEYMDGRMIGQKHVTPNFIRPFGMGREKWK